MRHGTVRFLSSLPARRLIETNFRKIASRLDNTSFDRSVDPCRGRVRHYGRIHRNRSLMAPGLHKFAQLVWRYTVKLWTAQNVILQQSA